MPAEIEPTELARLVDLAECSRVEDWSLRSALVRYAQPEPSRAGTILANVRRIDAVLHPQAKLLRAEGPAIWAALEGGGDAPATGPTAFTIAVLDVARRLHDLGDALAEWATDPAQPLPNDAVDAVTSEVHRRLDELGVPDERDRPPPPGVRRRG